MNARRLLSPRALLGIGLFLAACDSTTGPGPVGSGPSGTFQRILATGNSESGKFVRQTPGGFLLLEGRGSFGQHTIIARTNSNGDLISESSLHSSEGTYLSDAVSSLDGGAAALISGGDTLQVFKIGENGDVLWHTPIQKRQLATIAQTPDGAFIVVGGDGDDIGAAQSLMITRISASGNEEWQVLNETPARTLLDMDVTSSGAIVMTGYADGLYIGRADGSGHIVKEKVFEGESGGVAIATIGEDAVIAGEQGEPTFLMKVSSDGESVWKKPIGADYIYDIAIAPDHSILVAGVGKRASNDAVLVKLDDDGKQLWSKVYGRAYADRAISVTPLQDGIVLCGASVASTGNFPPDEDVLLIRTDRNGSAAPIRTSRVCPEVDNPPAPPEPVAVEREWRLTHGPVNDGSFYGMAVSPGGNVYGVAGYHVYYLANDEWKIVDVRAPDLLFGIAAVEDDYIVASGSNHLLFHFDGQTWKSYSSPAPHYSYSVLGCVWGTSRNDIFAAGESAILHFNGTAWSQMATPVSENVLGLWGSASTDVWAVTQSGSFLHYDGASWTKTYDYDADLRGVWGSSSNDVYVVGMAGVLLHYDGAAWTPLNVTTANLDGVSGRSSSDVYVAGSIGSAQGVLLHYDGVAWTNIASQIESGNPPPLHETLAASNNRLFVTRRDFDPRVYWFDGAQWNTSAKDEPSLYGVWADSEHNAIAVGDNGTVLHWDGDQWKSIPGLSAELRAVFAFSDEDIFVGTRRGAMAHFDGVGWTEMPSPATYVQDIWGSAPNDVYASGEILMHYDGSHWQDVTPTKPSAPFSVFGISRSEMYATDYNGIWHFDDCAWTSAFATQGTLYSIWCQPGTSVYAVGSNGTVIRHAGNIWRSLDTGDREDYSAVWARGANDVFVVGNTDFGGYFVMRHFDGQNWSSPPRTTSWALNDVFGSADGAVFVVGNGGVIASGTTVAHVSRAAGTRKH